MSSVGTVNPSAPAPEAAAAVAGSPWGAKRVAAYAAGVVALSGLAWGFFGMVAFERQPVTVEGVEVPADGDPTRFVRALARQWHETELSLDTGSRVVRLTRRELGARLDVDGAVEEVLLARGEGPIWSRAAAYLSSRDRNVVFGRAIDRERGYARLEELRDETIEPAVAVQYDGTGGRPGVTISALGAQGAVTDALLTDGLYVRLPIRRLTPPAPTERDRRNARYDEVVAAHETRYGSGGDLGGRARNIYLAARFLDGAVIDPHGTLSFNDVVGERSFERGFAPAIELTRGGRRTEGIGGGVCQVAATLHAAAFFAGFDMLEHHPHTRNSSYIPAGLDTAVSWPNKDLVVRNPHPYHVRVRATAHRGLLRIELMGQRRAPRVEWNTRVVSRIRRETEREVDARMAPNEQEVVDEGEDGSIMERTRTVYWPDGAVTETQRLRYPVVHRLVRGGSAAPGAAGSAPASTGAP